MSTVHQIYCTHCTHGSSALERREGDLAGRMLGYSARAGSMAAGELRRYYRQIERYVYYYLPRDTPVEEKLRLTAATAPRRLIYLPSTSGLQVLAQISYRPVDTEGRPGSYFAHALFREEKDGASRWSQIDCLKLWNAPGWVEEDSAQISFLLPTLISLDEMLEGRRPAIDDSVLLSFLTTSAGDRFDDPGGVIPPRWRQKQAEERTELFGETFCGLMDLLGGRERRRESLLLVVEPSIAALIFYGMVRLLPRNGIAQPISFSTFEPNAERLATTLAAIEFCDPERTELKSEAYRGRGFVVNTFTGRRSELRRPGSAQAGGPRRDPSNFGPETLYAETILRRLLDGGFEAVDWRLGRFQAAGVACASDLGQFAAVDSLAETLLGSGPTVDGGEWPASGPVKGYLRQLLERKLAESGDVSVPLARLVGTTYHLPVLELLATGPPSDAIEAGRQFLLDKLPADKIASLVRATSISLEAKIEALARYVESQANLPPDCESLWDEQMGMLSPMLGRLEASTLERFYANVKDRHGAVLIAALTHACREGQAETDRLSLLVRQLDETGVGLLYRNLGAAFFKQYPLGEPEMPARLKAILGSLAGEIQHFSERLDVVMAGEHLLASDRDRQIMVGWVSCRRAILKIGELEAQKSGVFRQRPIDGIEACVRQMTEAIAKALPADKFDDDSSGTRRQKCLQSLGRRLVGGSVFLPAVNWQNRALWQKVAWYFERGVWAQAPLRKLRPRPDRIRGMWLAVAAAGLAGLSIAAVAFLLRDWGASWTVSRPAPAPVTESRPSRQKPAAETRVPPSQSASPRKPVVEAERSSNPENEAAREAARVREEFQRRQQEALRAAEQRQQANPFEPPVESMASENPAVEAEETKSPTSELASENAAKESGMVAPPGRETREAWIRWAQQFAAQHRGAWFCQEPMVNGQLTIPTTLLPDVSESTVLYIGEGRLDFGDGYYLFGIGFEQQSPSTRQPIPRLASDLGLESVFVETRNSPSGPAIVVTSSANPQSDNPTLAALKMGCRQITAVVYLDAEVSSQKPAMPPLATPRKEEPEPNPSEPGLADADSRTVNITIDSRRATGLFPPAVAKIRVLVVGVQGKPLPSSLNKDFIFGCDLMGQGADGSLKAKHLADLATAATADVLQGTSAVRFRFQFYRRSDNPSDAEPVLLNETGWSVLPVKPGSLYTIKLELGEKQVEQLRSMK